jgi:hypothetical protein
MFHIFLKIIVMGHDESDLFFSDQNPKRTHSKLFYKELNYIPCQQYEYYA